MTMGLEIEIEYSGDSDSNQLKIFERFHNKNDATSGALYHPDAHTVPFSICVRWAKANIPHVRRWRRNAREAQRSKKSRPFRQMLPNVLNQNLWPMVEVVGAVRRMRGRVSVEPAVSRS